MKTKTIFKTLATAMLMPAMLLTTACSNSDDEIINTENPTNTKGYALPVTINVTRQGDDATTRATFDGSKLSFSTGDKLLVNGTYSEGGDDMIYFSGVLTWQSEGKFSGVILTQKEYSGTADDLLSSTGNVYATLLPAGYESYGYLSIAEEGTCTAYVDYDPSKAYALTKAAAVEQFSDECADSYSNGFALSPQNAIVSFTISGLTANTAVAVLFKDNYDISATPVNITTDESGVATFASAMHDNDNFDDYSLTVDGYAIALPEDKEVEAGKIYNMSRSMPVVIWNSTDISSIDLNFEGGSIEIRGITFACDGNVGFYGSGLYSMSGDISFTSSKGNIKKIEINHSGLGSWYGAEGFDGWPSDYYADGGTFTWEGTPVETVKLLETDSWGQIEGITSIVFTLE